MAGALCGIFWAASPLLENFQLGFLEWQYQTANSASASSQQPEDIAIVAFDDASQFDLGIARFNDERAQDLLASVIGKIEEAKPTLVGLDLDLRGNASAKLVDCLRLSRNVILGLFGTFDNPQSLPAPEFLNAASAYGYSDLPRESNGLVCRLPVSYMNEPGSTHIPSFGEAVIDLNRKIKGVGPASKFIAGNTGRSLYINFGAHKYPVISVTQLLSPTFNPQALKDKIVLVGSTLTARADDISRFRTPIADQVPEIFIQADAISSLMQNTMIATSDSGIAYHFLLLESVLAASILAILPLLWRATALVVLVMVSLVVAGFAFHYFYIALPFVPFAVIVTSDFILATFIYLDTDLRQRNRELARARKAMQERAEEERRRIAEDLHDETLPALSAASRLADQLASEVPESNLPKQMRERLDETLVEMRRVINDLHPSVLETMGFGPAIENLTNILSRDTGIACQFTDQARIDYRTLSDFKKLQIYRMVQEALNNVARHSRATMAEVTIGEDDGKLVISVIDNGCGMDPSQIKKDSHGLLNIRQRAQLIGAEVSWVKPQKYDSGCQFTVSLSILNGEERTK